MIQHAIGSFEVKLNALSLALEDGVAGTTRGRMSIDKQFSGALRGSSKGEMLTAMTEIQGSAGYVAIEKFNGTHDGTSGLFVLQPSRSEGRRVGKESVRLCGSRGWA